MREEEGTGEGKKSPGRPRDRSRSPVCLSVCLSVSISADIAAAAASSNEFVTGSIINLLKTRASPPAGLFPLICFGRNAERRIASKFSKEFSIAWQPVGRAHVDPVRARPWEAIALNGTARDLIPFLCRTA